MPEGVFGSADNMLVKLTLLGANVGKSQEKKHEYENFEEGHEGFGNQQGHGDEKGGRPSQVGGPIQFEFESVLACRTFQR